MRGATMKRIQTVVVVIALAALVGGCGNPMVGTQALDFRAKDLSGNEIVLSELRGNVVLIDFWATWCPPCIEELPNVKRIYGKNKDKDFVIIGISVDREFDDLEAFLEGSGIDWPQIFDYGVAGGRISDAYRVEFIPSTFLIDRNGIIRHVDLRDTELERAVSELLNETA
jgi:peroxiredoxin